MAVPPAPPAPEGGASPNAPDAVRPQRGRLSHDLTAALSSAGTRAQVARAILEKGLAVFAADAGAIFLLREDHPEEIEVVEQVGYGRETMEAWHRFPVSLRTPVTEAVRTREAVWVESVEDVRARFADFEAVPSYAAWAALPLCVGDRVIGALGLAYDREHGFGAEERAQHLAVAQRCAAALDRARASDRLREAVERLSLAKEAAGLGIHDYDVEAGTIRCDERVRALWGVDRDEPITYDTFLSGVHPADRQRMEAALAYAFDPSGGGRYDIEYRVVHRGDGVVRWVRATGIARFERGHAVRVVGTVQEITDQKRDDAHADLLARLYLALIQHRPPEELVDHTLREVARHLGVDGAMLCQIAPSGEVTVVATDGGGPDALAEGISEEARRALARGASLIVNDALLDPRTAQHTWGLRGADVAAMMIVPFVATADGPRLALCVTSRRPRRWRPDEERLLRDVSKNLFPALERARLEEALRSSEALLQVANDRFSAILTESSVTVYEQDLAFRYTWIANPGDGRTAEQMVGRDSRELFAIADQEKIDRMKREVIETGQTRRMDVFHRAADGEHWYDLHVHPRRDGGHVVGIQAVAFDVTDRKNAEHALRARERELQTLADHTPDLVSRFDRHLRHVFVGAAVERATGRPREAFLGKTYREAGMPEEFCRAWDQAVGAVFLSGREATLEFTLTGPEGERRYASRLVPEPGMDGRVEHVLSVARDVTERSRYEAALEASERQEREARAKAEQAANLAELFVAVLGHDLRNPLSAIHTAGMLIGRQSSEERVQRTAARIVSSSQRMARMIEQILDFTRIRSGSGLPYQPAEMDLRELMGRLREEVPAGDKAIRVDAKGATEGVWDADRLAQAMSNLLGNAVEHSPPGAAIQVQVDGSSPAWVVVTVQNPGAIPTEVLPEVFEPFRQGRPSGSKGLGLGLFITREIVAAHGGEIDVESSEAEGTCFRFVLPRAPGSPSQRPRS